MPRCAKCEGSSRRRPNHSQCRGGDCTCLCQKHADTVKAGNLDNLNLNITLDEKVPDDEVWIEQLDKVRDYYKEGQKEKPNND